MNRTTVSVNFCPLLAVFPISTHILVHQLIRLFVHLIEFLLSYSLLFIPLFEPLRLEFRKCGPDPSLLPANAFMSVPYLR